MIIVSSSSKQPTIIYRKSPGITVTQESPADCRELPRKYPENDFQKHSQTRKSPTENHLSFSKDILWKMAARSLVYATEWLGKRIIVDEIRCSRREEGCLKWSGKNSDPPKNCGKESTFCAERTEMTERSPLDLESENTQFNHISVIKSWIRNR